MPKFNSTTVIQTADPWVIGSKRLNTLVVTLVILKRIIFFLSKKKIQKNTKKYKKKYKKSN